MIVARLLPSNRRLRPYRSNRCRSCTRPMGRASTSGSTFRGRGGRPSEVEETHCRPGGSAPPGSRRGPPGVAFRYRYRTTSHIPLCESGRELA